MCTYMRVRVRAGFRLQGCCALDSRPGRTESSRSGFKLKTGQAISQGEGRV